MRKSLRFCLLLALVSISTMLKAQEKHRWVYICIGAENIVGNAAADASDKTLEPRFQKLVGTVDPAQFVVTQYQWEPALPSISRGTDKSAGKDLSFLDFFGRALVSKIPSTDSVGIICAGVNASKATLFDETGYSDYLAGQPSWFKSDVDNYYAGNPFQYVVDAAKVAMVDGTIKGIIFQPGTKDAWGGETTANQVKSIYQNLLSKLGLTEREVPLLVGEYPTTSTDRAANTNYAWANSTFIAKATANVIPYTLESTGSNYNRDDCKAMGEAFADKAYSLAMASSSDNWDPITQIDKDNFYLYIVFGQSNAEGYEAQPLAEDKIPNDNLKNIIAYDNFSNEDGTGTNSSVLGQWESVSEPNCRKSAFYPTTFGWVKAFGEEMLTKNPGKKFGFIHVAVASAGIRLFDKDQCEAFMAGTLTSPAPNTWAQKKARYAYAGNPYQRIIDMAKIAQQYGTIKGILMHQGEEDGWKSYWPGEVKKVYTDMLTDLSLNTQDVPLIFGEPTAYTGDIANMEALVTEGNAAYIPTSHKVEATDITGYNTLHFTHDGYVELGKRYAAIATQLLQPTSSIQAVGVGASASSGGFVKIERADKKQVTVTSTLPLQCVDVLSLSGAQLKIISLKGKYRASITPVTSSSPFLLRFQATDGSLQTLKLSLSSR